MSTIQSKSEDTVPSIPLEKAPHLRVTYATPKHLKSLETIFQRAFHPTNAFHRRVQPDTPLMRAYWRGLHEIGLSHPGTTIIIVEDTRADVDESKSVLAVCRLRLMGPQERGTGMFKAEELCADQDVKLLKELLAMAARWREESCLGREHYLIELFGVDPEIQGTGAGRIILQHICSLADERGCDVFVQANGFASPFYEKQGFIEEYAEYIEGEDGPYKEVKMLRHSQKKASKVA